MADVERVVGTVAAASGIAPAVDAIHPPDAEEPVGLASTLRSIWRRAWSVRAALLAIVTLLPERFAAVPPTLAAFRELLGGGAVLVRLRKLAARHLDSLPAPLGFRARVGG